MALNQLGLGFLLTAKDAASKVFNAVGSSLTGMQKQAGTAGATLEEAGQRIERVGRLVQGAGFAILGGLSAATVESSKFGKSIAEVSTLVDESTFSTKQMRDITLNAASTFGALPLEQTAGLYQAISGGADTAAKATDVLNTANMLAVGGATDVATGVGALNASLNVYGAEGLTAAGASDALFVGMKKGVTTVGELATAMGRVLPVSQSMGVSFDETIAAMSALTLKGINTNEAVTGLKAAFQNILAPTSEAEKAAKKLGITLGKDGIEAAGGLEKFLKKVAVAADGDFESFQKVFSSTEALGAVLALTGDDAGNFSAIMEEMAKKGGATQKAFEKMSNTFSFQSDLLKSKLTVAVIGVGEAFTPVLKIINEFVAFVVDSFNALPASMKSFLVTAATVAGVFLVVAGTALVLLGGFAALQAAQPALSAAMVIVRGKFKALMAVLGPLGIAAGAFFLLFKLNVGGFGDKVRAAVGKVMLAFDGLAQLFTTGEISGAAAEEFAKAENQGLLQFLVSVMSFVNAVENFFTRLGESFSVVMDEAKPALDAFGDALDKLFEAFGVSGEGAGTAESRFKAFGDAGAVVGKILGLLLEAVVIVATPFIDLAGWIFDVISPADLLKSVLSALAIVMVRRMVLAMVAMGKAALLSAGNVLKFVGSVISIGLTGFKSAASAIAGGIKAIGVAATTSLGGALALGFAILAIVAVADQALKLIDELGGGGLQTLSLEIQRDLNKVSFGALGITEKEFNERLGIQTGDDLGRQNALNAKVESDKREDARIAKLRGDSPAAAQGVTTLPEVGATTAAQGAAAPAATAAAASGAAQAKALQNLQAQLAGQQKAPTNINLRSTLVLDGQVLADKIQQVVDAGNAASGAS